MLIHLCFGNIKEANYAHWFMQVVSYFEFAVNQVG